MALEVTHKFVSDKADGEDPNLLQPSHWNDEHEINVPGTTLVGNSQSSEGDAEAIAILEGSGLKLNPATQALELEAKALVTADVVTGSPVTPLEDMPEHRALTASPEISWDKTVPNEIAAHIVDFSIALDKFVKQSRGGVIVFGNLGEAVFLEHGLVGEVLQSGTTATNAAWGGTGAPHALVRSHQATGVNDGAHPANAWTVRKLSTQVFDFLAIVQLGPLASPVVPDNAFRLDPGTYTVEWGAPGYKTGGFQSRLFNDTDNVQVAPGTSMFSDKDNGVTVVSTGMVKFDLTAAKNFQIQSFAKETHANGMGIASGSGQQEIYTWVKIWKMATAP